MISRYLITIALLAVVLSAPALATGTNANTIAAPISPSGQPVPGATANPLDPNNPNNPNSNSVGHQIRNNIIREQQKAFEKEQAAYDAQRRDLQRQIAAKTTIEQELRVKLQNQIERLLSELEKMRLNAKSRLGDTTEQGQLNDFLLAHFAQTARAKDGSRVPIDFTQAQTKEGTNRLLELVQSRLGEVTTYSNLVGAALGKIKSKEITLAELTQHLDEAITANPPPLEGDQPEDLEPGKLATRIQGLSPARKKLVTETTKPLERPLLTGHPKTDGPTVEVPSTATDALRPQPTREEAQIDQEEIS